MCPNCVPNSGVTIDTQIWTNCNLDVTTYRDGTPIPEVTDPSIWTGLTTGAWCYYNNNSTNGLTYGKLYNWYAVSDIIHGGLAPLGYHVPTSTEWGLLFSISTDSLKESGLCHWESPNTGTNSSNFTALPGGFRDNVTGDFNGVTITGGWWTITDISTPNAYAISIGGTTTIDITTKVRGYSVRLIKD